jgi:uncharacterized protein YggT (Ycf19 family)
MDMFKVYQLLSLALGALTWTLIGRGILALLLGERRRDNLVYRFFSGITSPLFRLSRLLSPPFVADAHLGYVALFLLLALRLALYMLFYSQGWIPSVSGLSEP